MHECLNLASLNNEPILFVVENNLFSSHMHISSRQSSDSTARFAHAHNVHHSTVDGNNILDLFEAASSLITRARTGQGPGFLEAVTFRWYGHVDWREDVDVGIKRSSTDISNWRKKDPISRLSKAMISSDYLEASELTRLDTDLREIVNEVWQTASSDPFPSSDQISTSVFS